MERELLTISEVSERLKIPKHTLRFWEREFGGFFTPQRTKGGQRRFTPEDVDWIKQVAKMRERGISLSRIKGELVSENREAPSVEGSLELLASRVSDLVKAEVYNYLRKR
jgi:DNA-binding transcriptional MerR regulator